VSTARRFTILLCNDLHYAGPTELLRGDDFRFASVTNPLVRLPLRFIRSVLWSNNPSRENEQLDRLLRTAGEPDLVIVNGDLACDAASLGVADAATLESARACIAKLRERFSAPLYFTIGDHELGKLTLLGERGGLRLESWRRCVGELGLKPFWQIERGDFVLLGVTSTLLALPEFLRDALAEEKGEWAALRETHLQEIRAAFAALNPSQRVLLFCHDPTALPHLLAEPAVQSRLGQIEFTFIGHLHSPAIFRLSGWLTGLPAIGFLGANLRRITSALNGARQWKRLRARLCPAPLGLALLNDGGFLTVELDAEAHAPAQFQFHPLRR